MSEQNPFAPPVADTNAAPIYRPNEGGAVTRTMIDHLSATQPWAKFIGVLGIIGAALMLLGSLVVLAAPTPNRSGGAKVGAALVYLLLAAVYGGLSGKLLGYCRSMRNVVASGSTHDLEQALDAQRQFWRLAGIVTIVSLSLIVLAIVVVIVLAANAHSDVSDTSFRF